MYSINSLKAVNASDSVLNNSKIDLSMFLIRDFLIPRNNEYAIFLSIQLTGLDSSSGSHCKLNLPHITEPFSVDSSLPII